MGSRRKVAAGIAGAAVVRVGSCCAREPAIGSEAPRASGDAHEMLWFECVTDPHGRLVNGTVAEHEELAISVLAAGAIAGGQSGRRFGGEAAGEREKEGREAKNPHKRLIVRLKHFSTQMFLRWNAPRTMLTTPASCANLHADGRSDPASA